MECLCGLKKCWEAIHTTYCGQRLGRTLTFLQNPFRFRSWHKVNTGFVPDLIRVPVNECEYQAQGHLPSCWPPSVGKTILGEATAAPVYCLARLTCIRVPSQKEREGKHMTLVNLGWRGWMREQDGGKGIFMICKGLAVLPMVNSSSKGKEPTWR